MKGFTLIELVVTVGISLAITGGIIVNYNSYNQTQTLKQAALTLKNDFRFIQAKANTGEKPAGCSTLTGWDITFALGSYSYRANCNGTPTGTSTTITLPYGVTITTLPSENPITLKVLAQGANLLSTTTITLTAASKSYSLQVTPGGDISDLGIQ